MSKSVRLFMLFVSILAGASIGLNFLFYKKIRSIVIYNETQNKINNDIIYENKHKNEIIENYLNKVVKNMSLSWQDYKKQYQQQLEKEKQQQIQQKINNCKKMFKDYINAVVLYPSEDFVRYVYLKTVYNNFLKDFYRKTRNHIKLELGSYGYETYYGVKKYDRNNFIRGFVFIDTPTKYNFFDIDPIPNLAGNNNYLALLAKQYDLTKLDLKQIKSKQPIYTDILFTYNINGTGTSDYIKNLFKTYYKIFKKCDDSELTGDTQKWAKNCGYLSQEDLDKIYKSFVNSIGLNVNYTVIDDKTQKQLQECYNIPTTGQDLQQVIDNNIKLHIKKFDNKVRTLFFNQLNGNK